MESFGYIGLCLFFLSITPLVAASAAAFNTSCWSDICRHQSKRKDSVRLESHTCRRLLVQDPSAMATTVAVLVIPVDAVFDAASQQPVTLAGVDAESLSQA